MGRVFLSFGNFSSSSGPCPRWLCLRHPDRTEVRQVAYFTGHTEEGKNTFTEKMKRKIDSATGRMIYGMRLAIAASAIWPVLIAAFMQPWKQDLFPYLYIGIGPVAVIM